MTMRWLWALAWVVAVGCGPPELGDSCSDPGDCKEVPSSYCARTGVCAASCSQVGSACGGGAGKCVEAFGRTVCLAACASDDACRATDRCVEGACVLVEVLAEP